MCFFVGVYLAVVVSSVTSRADSAEENSDGSMYLTSSDLELMHDGGRKQLVGVVFPAVGVSKKCDVKKARIVFDVDEVKDASKKDVTIKIFGEKNAAPKRPSSSAKDLSNRTPTTASVTWKPQASQAVHEELVTADISDIVKEIVGLACWTEGSSMAILFSHVSGDGTRWVESSSENNGVQTPTLEITCAPGGGDSSNGAGQGGCGPATCDHKAGCNGDEEVDTTKKCATHLCKASDRAVCCKKGKCAESKWPDKDHGLKCSDCKVTPRWPVPNDVWHVTPHACSP